MDYGTQRNVEPDPEDIREDMRATRASITEKLERIEERVTSRVDTVQHKVEDTVDTVKHAVQDGMQSVRRTLDLPQQTRRHPWAMFGGALITGLVIGRMGSRKDRRFSYPQWSETPKAIRSDPPVEEAAHKEPGVVQKAKAQFREQFGILEAAAITGASGLFGRIAKQAIPGLAPFLDRSREGRGHNGSS